MFPIGPLNVFEIYRYGNNEYGQADKKHGWNDGKQYKIKRFVAHDRSIVKPPNHPIAILVADGIDWEREAYSTPLTNSWWSIRIRHDPYP